MSRSSSPVEEGTLINGVNLVILVVTLSSYASLLFDPRLMTLGLPRITLLVGLGVVYLVVGIYGWSIYEKFSSPPASVVFFGTQLTITAVILFLAGPLMGQLWVLVLPIAGQSLGLPRAGTVVICLLLLVILGLTLRYHGVGWQDSLSSLVSITAAMMFVLVFTHVAIRETQARQEIQRLAGQLEEANQKLRAYAVQAEELAIIKERNRLAREIHDTLGHYLTVMNVQLGAAQAVFESDRGRALDAVNKVQQLTQEGLREVRRSVAALRESPAEKQPITEAIAGLISQMRSAGVVAESTIKGTPRALNPKTSLTLYRATQEALTNVRKHAHASRVDVAVDFSDESTVQLLVRDNGVGAQKSEGGFGLLGLQERVQLLGGRVEIETAAGQGFMLIVEVPG